MRSAPVAAAVATAALLAGCSAANLSFAEVERDLDAIVQVETRPDGDRLVYRDVAEISAWYARSTLLLPVRPLLIGLFGGTTVSDIEQPSGAVRELLVELAPKAGDDPLRTASAMQRLVRIAELDASALNRLYALDALGQLAAVHSIDVLAGVDRPVDTAAVAERLDSVLDDFRRLRPVARTPVGAPLPPPDAVRYVTAIEQLTELPLTTWQQRLGLVADLASALRYETMADLRETTANALHRATGHVIRWTLVRALQGRAREWVQVRRGTIDILHRLGGSDCVPLLLALLAEPGTPDGRSAGQAGPAQFEQDWLIQLRLIHLCGQLDRDRAMRAVRLPGRESWQEVAPVDFLAQVVLASDPLFSQLRLPATEALAQCLGRPQLGLAEAPASQSDAPAGGDAEWVESWYRDYTRERVRRSS